MAEYIQLIIRDFPVPLILKLVGFLLDTGFWGMERQLRIMNLWIRAKRTEEKKDKETCMGRVGVHLLEQRQPNEITLP